MLPRDAHSGFEGDIFRHYTVGKMAGFWCLFSSISPWSPAQYDCASRTATQFPKRPTVTNPLPVTEQDTA